MTTCEHGALARTCIICSEWKPRALEAEEEAKRLRALLAAVVDGWVDTRHGITNRTPDIALVDIDAMVNAQHYMRDPR